MADRLFGRTRLLARCLDYLRWGRLALLQGRLNALHGLTGIGGRDDRRFGGWERKLGRGCFARSARSRTPCNCRGAGFYDADGCGRSRCTLSSALFAMAAMPVAPIPPVAPSAFTITFFAAL